MVTYHTISILRNCLISGNRDKPKEDNDFFPGGVFGFQYQGIDFESLKLPIFNNHCFKIIFKIWPN